MIGNMKSKFSNEASPSSLVFCNNLVHQFLML